MDNPNERQVGGEHYKAAVQHWDLIEYNGLGYLEGNATKYISRWRKKNGLEDLQKALHYVDKMIDLASRGVITPRGFVTLQTIREFCEANQLNDNEAHIISCLLTWRSLQKLKDARYFIVRLVNAEQERRAQLLNDKTIIPAGRTEHPSPFGYQGEN